ncbi:hypothetical protein QYE76_022447 [Lolium multiflorum]|uniref:Retrotransposon gag domain-containing protein n=1 Tax=Lolium multiflorum TaxID=4521 RepID=A0AAD8R9Z4_LOLMU|nr:hypothetical protein QYE76_022447 [Lolium multiflorum]
MLATAMRFANTAMAMLDERKEAESVMNNFLKREREAVESLEQAKKLRKHWEAKMSEAQKDADRIRQEAITPRKITFATPTDQQLLTTPKDNMKKAAELLPKKDEEIDIKHKDASGKQHRDDESRTGSTERRRKTKEHANPIPVPSETPPRDPSKGKGPMYAGKYKYRNPSPPPRIPRPPPPSRRRSPAGNAMPHGLGGINIRDNVPPSRNMNMERTPEPRRSRNDDREPEPRRSRTKNASPNPAEAGTTQATVTKEKVATEAGVSRGKSTGNPKAERLDTWIEDYYNAVTFAGGTPNITCRMLQLYLVGPARVWLSDLEKNSIFCWFDLKNAENHFRGTYKRPATTSDLQACIQKKGETSKNFLTRWLATRNECENVDNRTAMHAFIGGLQRGGLLRHKLTCLVNANKLTLDE